MKLFARILKSLRYRIIDRDYVPYFAKKSFQPIAIMLLNLSLRLLGFNNYGPSAKSGEEFFLRRLLATNPEFCIDVGANVGKYSEFILRNSSSRVLAFEPLSGAFQRLQILQNQFTSRLTIENLGCARNSGELKLYFGSETSELASFSNEVNQIDYVGASNVNSVSVRTTSLDDYFQHNPFRELKGCDLLKIDTEGFEYEVLLGASNFISQFKPRVVQIEFNLHHLYQNHSLRLIGELLYNYKAFRLLPNNNGMIPIEKEDFLSNIYQYSNYVFILSDWCNNPEISKILGI